MKWLKGRIQKGMRIIILIILIVATWNFANDFLPGRSYVMILGLCIALYILGWWLEAQWKAIYDDTPEVEGL